MPGRVAVAPRWSFVTSVAIGSAAADFLPSAATASYGTTATSSSRMGTQTKLPPRSMGLFTRWFSKFSSTTTLSVTATTARRKNSFGWSDYELQPNNSTTTTTPPSAYGTATSQAVKEGTSTNEMVNIDIDEDDNNEANRPVKKRYWSHEEEERLQQQLQVYSRSIAAFVQRHVHQA
ncbi:unnamed protein product [Miscanthus lutarioriparius]|uniref:Uncharacterized protein n=1 Tax=Miscanthus lutarioriparius TaxID=422564 RepID=A0A811S9J2_9POAL|nr:unnamed protein product [Miscanthus lutarioriparius]